MVAIAGNRCQHGIFIGFLDGVVKLGTYDVDRTNGQETVDLLQFASDPKERLLRVTYEKDTCIDPSKTISYARNGDLFDFNESGAQNAFKCKTGISASEQTLHVLRRSTDTLIEMHHQQKTVKQLKKIIDRAFWIFK